MEIDALYVDTIMRWQAYTHKHAVKADTGATFSEYEANTGQQPTRRRRAHE
jgi:hypothetical protein